MKCHKCKKEMTMTPVCVGCGIIPIAEGSFAVREAEIVRLRNQLGRCVQYFEIRNLGEYADALLLEIKQTLSANAGRQPER